MINNFKEVKECIYKDEHYSVRDNGAVMRHLREGEKVRIDDNRWTFGLKNTKTGYMMLGQHRVHIIVATAFYGARDSKIYVVDHIDTNRCNNRVENLRWFTRLENALNNEITKNKIIYICGSIEAFVENPNILRERLNQVKGPSLEWMRTVTPNEAKAAYDNVRKYWAEQAKKPKPLAGSKLNEGIYTAVNQKQAKTINSADVIVADGSQSDFIISNEEWEQMTRSLIKPDAAPTIVQNEIENNTTENVVKATEEVVYNLVKAKSPETAWQMNWKTPTDFLCCPTSIGDNPIAEYFDRLVVGNDYNSTSYYGESEPSSIQQLVEKALIAADNTIVVISYNKRFAIKPYALSKISFRDGMFIHESLGTFFEEDGVRKCFTLAQGLEWTGEETFDDYC